MSEKPGIRERKERFQERLVKHGTAPDKAESIARNTIRRLEHDGRLDKVSQKERRQRNG